MGADVPRRNLADPSYEPSDDELRELSQRAFAHIPAQQARVARELSERIAVLREAAATAAPSAKAKAP